MFNYVRSLFHDKRKQKDEICDACEHNRRRISRREATERLEAAASEMARTVTLSPEKVQELLRKAKL